MNHRIKFEDLELYHDVSHKFPLTMHLKPLRMLQIT